MAASLLTPRSSIFALVAVFMGELPYVARAQPASGLHRCVVEGRTTFQQSPCPGSGGLVADEIAARERAVRQERERLAQEQALNRERTRRELDAKEASSRDLREKTERHQKQQASFKPSCDTNTLDLRLGMTLEEVRRCTVYGLVAPKAVNRTVTASGQLEQHVYRIDMVGTHYLYFRAGVLTSWQTSQ